MSDTLAVERKCCCECGCHSATDCFGYRFRCRNEPRHQVGPDYDVWACDECMEMCDE